MSPSPSASSSLSLNTSRVFFCDFHALRMQGWLPQNCFRSPRTECPSNTSSSSIYRCLHGNDGLEKSVLKKTKPEQQCGTRTPKIPLRSTQGKVATLSAGGLSACVQRPLTPSEVSSFFSKGVVHKELEQQAVKEHAESPERANYAEPNRQQNLHIRMASQTQFKTRSWQFSWRSLVNLGKGFSPFLLFFCIVLFVTYFELNFSFILCALPQCLTRSSVFLAIFRSMQDKADTLVTSRKKWDKLQKSRMPDTLTECVCLVCKNAPKHSSGCPLWQSHLRSIHLWVPGSTSARTIKFTFCVTGHKNHTPARQIQARSFHLRELVCRHEALLVFRRFDSLEENGPVLEWPARVWVLLLHLHMRSEHNWAASEKFSVGRWSHAQLISDTKSKTYEPPFCGEFNGSAKSHFIGN